MPSVKDGNSVDDGKDAALAGKRPEAINLKKRAGQGFRYEVGPAKWAAQNVYCPRSRRDVFRVLSPSPRGEPRKEVFAAGLNAPFGISFYPPGADPQWVYVANTNSVVRFDYASGDLKAQGQP
jgi:hypothetical protein